MLVAGDACFEAIALAEARVARAPFDEYSLTQRKFKGDGEKMDYQPEELLAKRQRQQARRLLAACAVLLLLIIAFALRAFHIGRAPIEPAPDNVSEPEPTRYRQVEFAFGRGYIGAGWQVYFNQPDESVDRADYADGMDVVFAKAIEAASETLDIAIFELNSGPIHAALAGAAERGLSVRIVADDDHGLRDERNPHIRDLAELGIDVRDDSRTGLMHNKFAIIDRETVWTGSWNYTVNGTYRNNNNILTLKSVDAVHAYQAEFDEMFERAEFGIRSTDDGIARFEHAGGDVSIIFAPEADEVSALIAEIEGAARSIRFMTYVFSLEELAEAMLSQAASRDVTVAGVFEKRNSTASWSQLPALHCAGAAMRQDGNRYVLHHKVIIIDEHTVITGSFNFSRSAEKNNDENIVIVRHAAIADLYLREWRRIWDSAEELAPGEVVCD